MRTKEQTFWDRHARHDPLWAILSDPTKAGRRWDLPAFLETGRREVSLLMYQLRALDIAFNRHAALDFGCGIGRLSQPLARYFDRVVGVDISAEMVRLANEINEYPERVRYWSQREVGPMRLGNHWLAGIGHTMLIQDDGRALLPPDVTAGETCHLTLQIRLPDEPGEYQLECDVVHEGISWFADKGSPTWKRNLRVGDVSNVHRSVGATTPIPVARTLCLSDEASLETPDPFPMHGIHRDVVQQLIHDNGGTLVHLETDERCGKEWIGYRYFVRKT